MIKLGRILSPFAIAEVSNNVFNERYFSFSKSGLKDDIKWSKKNATGIPPPNNSEFFERLNTLEKKKEIELVENINRNSPSIIL